MFISNNRQFVFKQSSGKVWNIFSDEKRGLLYTILTKRNIWAEPVSVQKNILPQFFADIDYEDRFHIIFQDKQGNISYSLLDDNTVKTLPVLNSKVPSAYNKYLNLIPFKNNIHFFYVLQHNDTYMLAHQTLNDGNVNPPKVVDYVVKTDCPYSVVYDSAGSIYVFYQSSDGKNYQVGYKKLSPGQKYWGEFIPVSHYEGSCELPRTLIDNRNVIHLCYQRTASRQYELVYQQKVPDKNIWTGDVVMHTSAYSFNESSVVYLNNSIIVYWIRDDYIYYSLSKDGGATWSKPVRYNFAVGKQLICITYKSNDPYEKDRITVKDIPGSFINGVTFAFYQDATQAVSDLSPEELKNMIVDSLKMLKGSIDELKEQYSGISEEIQKINLEQEKQEKDLVKFSVKLGIIESEINQLKSVNSRLESYRNELQDYKSQTALSQSDLNKLKENLVTEILKSGSMQKSSADILALREDIENLKKSAVKKSSRHIKTKNDKTDGN